MRRFLMLCLALLALSACKRDTPEEARARAQTWLHLGEQVHFSASAYCAVGVYRLTKDEARGTLYHVSDAERALWHIRQDHPIAMHHPDKSPNDFSQELMSRDLPEGLGLLSSATGPRECMTDDIARGVFVILMTPEAWTIYDPGTDVLVLADFRRGYAVYMRGNV